MTNKYMYFIANWKMFGGLNSLNSLHKVVNFLKTLKKINLKNNLLSTKHINPSNVKKIKNSNIEVGAQNCHENDTYGAFTGSINSNMLKNVGAKYVIIGHSENRQSGETINLLILKLKVL